MVGVLLCQQLAELPAVQWSWLLPVCVVLALRTRGTLRLGAWSAVGLLYALLHAHSVLGSDLSAELEGRDLIAVGRLAGLPVTSDRAVRFEFDLDSLHLDGQPVAGPGRVRLSWYGGAPALAPGERWQLRVRLKRPHGFMNPGGFDYEGWLFQNRIRATGYVRAGGDNRRLEPAGGHQRLLQLRHALLREIQAVPVSEGARALISALALGYREHIDSRQWDVLTRTGTNHLVAISGLHVGLVGGLLFVAVRRLWAWAGAAALWLPAPKAAAVASVLGAAGYAALAGFAVPTQRALIMLGVVMAALWWQRGARPSHTLALALLAVLLFDPLAVLAAGFWLSFGAVAAILYGATGRLGRPRWWEAWGRVQWVVALGLLPLLVAFFQRASLVAPLANLLAVPVVSLAVVPLVLLGAALLPLLPAVGVVLLQGAGWVLDGLWWCLEGLAGLPAAVWVAPAVSGSSLLLAGAGVLVLLAPRGLAFRWVGTVLCLPLLLGPPERPPPGEAWFTLLDVGQGLAAVVQTHRHVLVFDTGPRFSDRFDAGAAVVVPFLRARGVQRIDRLIVSHGDSDHRGGLEAVLQAYPGTPVFTAAPERIAWAGPERCAAGQAWRWDEVEFRMLHPGPGPVGGRGNDQSCVLRVATPAGSVLLTGDIEKAAERRLLTSQREWLRADLLVAPHHGSKTSSTAAFIAAVAPEHVLFPIGYRNRFGFPHADVLAAYVQAGVQHHDSARHGALSVRLGGQGPPGAPQAYRETARRYWHNR